MECSKLTKGQLVKKARARLISATRKGNPSLVPTAKKYKFSKYSKDKLIKFLGGEC